MLESGSSGSVRGASRNGRPYRERLPLRSGRQPLRLPRRQRPARRFRDERDSGGVSTFKIRQQTWHASDAMPSAAPIPEQSFGTNGSR
jgi:hypothetical protein